jgi:hypothetical protein
VKFRYLLVGLCAVGDGGEDDVGEDADDEEDADDDDEDKDTDDNDDDDDAEFKVGRSKLSCLTRSASRKARLASCLAALSCKYLYEGRPDGASGE